MIDTFALEIDLEFSTTRFVVPVSAELSGYCPKLTLTLPCSSEDGVFVLVVSTYIGLLDSPPD